MMSSLALVLSIFWLRDTWEKRKDSCSLPVLCVLSVLLGTLNFAFDPQQPGSTLERTLQYFWIVSHYLQVGYPFACFSPFQWIQMGFR